MDREKLTPYQRALREQQRRVVDDMRRRLALKPVEWRPLR